MSHINKRASTRSPLEVEVLTLSNHNFSIAGRSLDISMKGLFVMAPRCLPIGTRCRLRILGFNVQASGAIELEGRVVRTARSGMGIEFTPLDPKAGEELQRLITATTPGSISSR